MLIGQNKRTVPQLTPRLQRESFDVTSSVIERHFDWSEVQRSPFENFDTRVRD